MSTDLLETKAWREFAASVAGIMRELRRANNSVLTPVHRMILRGHTDADNQLDAAQSETDRQYWRGRRDALEELGIWLEAHRDNPERPLHHLRRLRRFIWEAGDVVEDDPSTATAPLPTFDPPQRGAGTVYADDGVMPPGLRKEEE